MNIVSEVIINKNGSEKEILHALEGSKRDVTKMSVR
jgi:hypothetical protein